jgi:hypothetical protein
MNTATLTGISLKPVSEILTQWETRAALTNEHKDDQMVQQFLSENPYRVLFSLAYALDLEDHHGSGSAMSEDQKSSLFRLVQELAIKTGRKEGAL